jgi:hypothetical protein
MNADSQPVSVARLIVLPARVKLRPLAQRSPACYGSGGGGVSLWMIRTRQDACSAAFALTEPSSSPANPRRGPGSRR